jgi:acyl-CoA synthetase (AMP-forming)/AMP-acid ligase II
MIKTSGYRVSPTEIEEAAYSTSVIRDAVAVGVADPALGQRIILVVTSPNGVLDSATVMSALRPLLPLYMLPARVEVWDELPRSANGKFDRAVIRAEVSA